MEINNTPQYKPAFQARNLSRVISKTKQGLETVVDVYSLDSRDKVFINRMSEVIKGHALPEDTLMIGEKDAKTSVKDSLQHVFSPKKRYSDSLLIAIENKKKILGILDCRERGDIDLHTFYMFQDNNRNTGRKALLLQALKNIKRQIDVYAQIQPERMTEKAKKYFRNLGFGKEFGDKDLLMSNTKIHDKIDKIQNSAAISVKEFRSTKNVDLVDVLKLDE